MLLRTPRSMTSAATPQITVRVSLESNSRDNRFFTVEIAESPKTWSYFYITGAPYRAYLFRAGRRTNFWIIHTIDDDTKTINVLRFWNATREPAAFEI